MLKDPEASGSASFPARISNSEAPDRSRQSERAMKPGQVGFIGLGRMGTAMAANLTAAGRHVIGYIRRPEQGRELEALGVKPTTDIADLFDCEFVISMLPDDAVVHEVIFGRTGHHAEGLLAGLTPGSVHMSMSTITTAAAAEFASAHAERGQDYVAAPVFGNPDAASARQLFVIAAGAPTAVQRCQPILTDLGQRTFLVGEDPGTANLIKLIGNAISAVSMETLGEVFALARKRGLDSQQLLAILTGTMYGGRFHTIYGGKIAGEQYGSGGFLFPLILKDVRLALGEAESAGVPTPSVSVVRDRLIAGIARGYADRDWSALGLLASEEAGLPVEHQNQC
jgi:3-hydroxyisobutyrate dehydrogenase-like beta-hydroxyacid dehydrogenase